MSLLQKLKKTPLRLLAHSTIVGALIFSSGCDPWDKSHKHDPDSGSSAPATSDNDTGSSDPTIDPPTDPITPTDPTIDPPSDPITPTDPTIDPPTDPITPTNPTDPITPTPVAFPFDEKQDNIGGFNPAYQNPNFISNSDWQKYVNRLLPLAARTEMDSLESKLTQYEQIFKRAVSSGDALYIVNVSQQETTSYADDFGSDGIPEYVGKKKFSQQTTSDLENILITDTTKASAVTTLAAMARDNAQISYDDQIDLPGQGAVKFDVVYIYTVNGQSIAVGALYNSAEEPADPAALQKIENFNSTFRNQGTYLPVSAIVVPKSIKLETAKKIDAEFEYHEANNPQ